MFYIEKLSRINRRDITLLHIAPAVLVFLAFFGLTLWNWVNLRNSVNKNRNDLLVKNIHATSDSLVKSINDYENILNAGAGLFSASAYVDKNEWDSFIDIFNINDNYPGIRAVGFSKYVSDHSLKSYQKEIAEREHMKLKISPSAKRNEYAPIVYSAPQNKQNKAATGFDMFSNKQMRAAMLQARDSGESTITSKIEPENGSPFGKIPTVIIYTPIYAKGKPTSTITERRQSIWGYTYAEVLTYKLINTLYDPLNGNFAFAVYDDSTVNGEAVYRSPNIAQRDSEPGRQAMTKQFGIDNQRWTILGEVSPEILSARERSRPTAVLWGGTLFSLFLATFIYTLLLNRTRALADREEKDIQSAKDELLALASHQLRTPATGVKQYIGMLREGYGGKLTSQQKKLLDQAYSSNERQLHTINDMLFVARADTGDIQFNLLRMDLLAFMKDLLDEQQQLIRANQQKLIKKLPKKSVFIWADKGYLRMALENLLSNARKYTSKGGTVTVSLKVSKGQAVISVEDTGVGVKHKYQHLLFRKFSRVPNELSDQVAGSGIGLYLAKKVTDAHGGDIEFKSLPGKGSICTMYLPLKTSKKKG